MIELLRLVRRDYGGAIPYLHSVCVCADEIGQLRDSLVEQDKRA